MRKYKFRYIFEIINDVNAGNRYGKVFTLDDIQRGAISMHLSWNSVMIIDRVQFTGLKDCKGTEIYEGDIVREAGNIPPAKDELYIVEYRDEVGAFMFKDQWNDYDPYSDMGEIEYIGNVYENPELLERIEK